MFNGVEVTCAQCNEPFQISRQTFDVLKRSSQPFHCPWGHTNFYPQGKSEAEKLRGELDRERRRRQSAEQNIEYHSQRASRAERSAAAYKGQATKLRKRAKAGTCPCCKRHFSQLERHMAAKHPEFEISPDGDLPKDVAPILTVVGGNG